MAGLRFAGSFDGGDQGLRGGEEGGPTIRPSTQVMPCRLCWPAARIARASDLLLGRGEGLVDDGRVAGVDGSLAGEAEVLQ
jgi:hypothetical protein